MDQGMPCVLTGQSGGFWVFIVLGVISHARGTVLLVREARLWFRECRGRRRVS